MKMNIWIGCHATYNDGFLFDKQYTITDTNSLDNALEDAEKHFLKSLKEAKPEWDKEGYITDHYCEELYIADYEPLILDNGTEIGPDTGESVYDLRKFLEVDYENFEHPLGLLMKLEKESGKELEELDRDISYITIEGSNYEECLGYEFVENTCLLSDASETVKNYFDYESFGRDLILGGDYSIYEIDGMVYAVDNQSY